MLCLFFMPLDSLAACSKNQPGWLWNYNGELAGKFRIRMTLVFAATERHSTAWSHARCNARSA
jgi:hypothetical protein